MVVVLLDLSGERTVLLTFSMG